MLPDPGAGGLIVVSDADRTEHAVATGQLVCPDGRGTLRP